ncbi:uncharacterized protein [Coffea arabica]|uniref:Uncharacterized protein n=1 Tax=Coffea arabica TaxID=13443 RepID=A0A6P6WM47_COFAR|nr:uncharacterized protein LOC113716669 [Coffea arabica]XP_027115681.1 uncharacterized protein LOC113733646 [Coffea arabica]
MAENGNENVIRYEEGMSCLLPANAFDQQQSCLQEKLRYQKHHQSERHYSKSPAADNSHWKSGQLGNQRTRNGGSSNTKWAIGGPGMQALFLDSGQRSCGTGVFLPRRAGTHFPSSNRPACPPVLLPSRVVQVLNLNVHELGFQSRPQQQERTGKQSNAGGKKENINAAAGVGSGGGQCCSPEIFLPKEWTY